MIQPEALEDLGDVDREVIFAESGAEDPQLLYQLVSAPNVFKPFVAD